MLYHTVIVSFFIKPGLGSEAAANVGKACKGYRTSLFVDNSLTPKKEYG